MNTVADRAAEILDRIARNRANSSDLCAQEEVVESASTDGDSADSTVSGEG
jgi:hypothetical protein